MEFGESKQNNSRGLYKGLIRIPVGMVVPPPSVIRVQAYAKGTGTLLSLS